MYDYLFDLNDGKISAFCTESGVTGGHVEIKNQKNFKHNKLYVYVFGSCKLKSLKSQPSIDLLTFFVAAMEIPARSETN